MDADLYDQLSTTVASHPDEVVNERSDAQPAAANQEPVEADKTTRRPRTTSSSLPQEIDQVVHAISNSPWAARLGSLVGTVRKQVDPSFVA
jgi:hypothetical protein